MRVDLQPGDIITDIVVVVECLTDSGVNYLSVISDEHTNWLKEQGMLSFALKRVQNDY